MGLLEEQDVNHLGQIFRRIFAFPVSRITFKEVQRSVFSLTKEDRDRANQIMDALLTGESKQDKSPGMQALINDFTPLIRLSKDVLEKGEFISFLSSDLVNPSHPLFINQIRRIDGQEFQFLTEPEGVVHLLKHFVRRIEELQRMDKSNGFFKNQSNEIKTLCERLEKLAE